MGLHQPLRDAEAHANPGANLPLRLPEPVKDARQFRFRNSLPSIAHGKPRLGPATLGLDEDRPSCGRELDGIADEVRKDLQHSLGVTTHSQPCARHTFEL